MRRRRVRAAVLASAAAASLVSLAAPAGADPGVLVYPGMEIRQGNNLCTLGFVDVVARTAYTAGHCRGDGNVTDRDGHVLGHQETYRDDTPNGAVVATDHMISDWETITLAPDVQVNDILPGGRTLALDPAMVPQQGQPVCHFGVVTGESCGTVQSVNNGWFTMANGVVSKKGDSGGPVYVLADDGRAVIVGMFNSTWGDYPAAVSWSVTDQQIRQQVFTSAAGTVPAPPPA
ncbi:hypothetical protein H7J06_15900 [Mycobacterium hodleri]|uniref:Rv1815 family serine proteinase n=1 Tax=Mycolicibacterium hodleri TaxID=49897 RepID=UPI00355695C2|nr:hypothetical protein [Mycolicibacterium hodleri]